MGLNSMGEVPVVEKKKKKKEMGGGHRLDNTMLGNLMGDRM